MSWIVLCVLCVLSYAAVFIVGHWFFRVELVKSLGNAKPWRKK